MTTERPPLKVLWSAAETGFRRAIIELGLGVFCCVVGSLFAAGAVLRIEERLGRAQGPVGQLMVQWALQGLWLVTVLPACGWIVGRLTQLSAGRLAVVSAVTGEVFSLALSAGVGGVELLWADVSVLAGHGLGLGLGIGMTAWATQRGREAAERAAAEAAAIAAQRKSEYDAFLAAAEQQTQPKDSAQD